MIIGLLAGITWALETVVLGMALSMSPFCTTAQAVVLAAIASTALHDAFSAIWATVYNLVRGNIGGVGRALGKRGGRSVVLGALIGGPVGMTGYSMAVNYMGSSIGAVASAVYPAIGAVLAYLFLKERMTWYRWIFLILTLLGVFGLGFSPDLDITNFWLGLLGAFMCSFGWGTEAVILSASMKDPEVKDEYALQIRQTSSALAFGLVILPLMRGRGFTLSLFADPQVIGLIALAAFFATVSYLLYYRAIARLGASRAMALNVTYSAWALIFTVVLLRDSSALSPVSVLCTLIVLVCGVLSAAEIKDLRSGV